MTADDALGKMGLQGQKTREELQAMTVDDLRKYARGNTNIPGTQIIALRKEALIEAIHSGPEQGETLPGVQPETKSNGKNGKDEKLVSLLAEMLNGKVQAGGVDAEAVREIARDEFNKYGDNMYEHIKHTIEEGTDAVQKALKELQKVKPIAIKTATGEVKDVGVQHYLFPRILELAHNRVDTMLVGPAGSGKTTACHKVAEALNLSFRFLSVGLQTTKSDLIGYMDATGKYVSTHLRKAYEQGGVFLLDEIDAGNANVITAINAMLSNGVAPFPDAIVERHANFVFFCSGNTWGHGIDRQYVGRNQMDAATLDRFVSLNFDYDEGLEKALCPDAEWVERVQAIRKAVFDLKEKVVVSPRASLRGALLLKLKWKRAEVEDATIFKGVNQDVKKRVLERVS